MLAQAQPRSHHLAVQALDSLGVKPMLCDLCLYALSPPPWVALLLQAGLSSTPRRLLLLPTGAHVRALKTMGRQDSSQVQAQAALQRLAWLALEEHVL